MYRPKKRQCIEKGNNVLSQEDKNEVKMFFKATNSKKRVFKSDINVCAEEDGKVISEKGK